MRTRISDALELLGLALVLLAAFCADWRLGVAVIGATAVAAGFIIDAPSQPAPDDEVTNP
jgi:hypothetical protein